MIHRGNKQQANLIDMKCGKKFAPEIFITFRTRNIFEDGTFENSYWVL